MISRLKQTFHDDVLSGKIECRSFFTSIEDESSELVIEFCRWIISTFEYQAHTHCVKGAFRLLAELRDVSSMEQLTVLREVWTNTYLSEYEYLLALFLNAASGAKCNCNVYQNESFNVPPYQKDLEEIECNTDEIQYDQTVSVQCKICGTRWDVGIDYSYHYPHSHWRKR
jgi:hypothetical protein